MTVRKIKAVYYVIFSENKDSVDVDVLLLYLPKIACRVLQNMGVDHT